MQDGGPLQEYDVESGGVTLRLRLSDADARKRGLLTEQPEPKQSVQAASAPAKTRKTSARNKKRDVEPEATGGE